MLLKKIFCYWWRNTNLFDSEFLSYNLMLNSGKKNSGFCATNKNEYSNSVLSEKKNSERNKKP